MQIYTTDKEDVLTLVQSVASASTMISSVIQESKNYILSKFPENYFKKITIETSENNIQQDQNAEYNNLANKIPYPAMHISPEISLDDPITGVGKSLTTSSPNVFVRKDIRQAYKYVTSDPKNHYKLFYTCDYITTNINFKIVCNKFIQNADISFFLKSNFQKDFFQYLNGCNIYTEVPKTFIKLIAGLNGFDLNNQNDLDKFRLFMIGTSLTQDKIEYRRSASTGQPCFFFNEKVNMLTLFTDLDSPSTINMEGHSEGEYIINFRFQVSTYFPNAFIFIVDKNTIKKASQNLIKDIDKNSDPESGIISWHAKPLNILNKQEIKLFKDKRGNDQYGILIYDDVFTFKLNSVVTLNLMSKIRTEFQRIHNYALNEMNMNPSSLFFIELYDHDGIINKSTYSLDYKTMTLTVNRNKDLDFSVALYINRTAYETINKMIEKEVNTLNDNYIGYIMSKIGNQNIKIALKNFKTPLERNDSDRYPLRVKTVYGINYVSLVDNDDKDGYKVCVGFNNGKPIIMKMEIKNNL